MLINQTNIRQRHGSLGFKSARGFTLLEVLVAISIFAIIGLGANQMLRTVINTHDHTQASIKLHSEYSHALTVMDRDLSQAVPRGIRDEYGDQQPAFLVGLGPFPLEFTRTGWNNPIGLPRSNLQRVAYEMNEDSELVRSFWTVLDRAEDAEPIEQILLTDISDFRISVISADGESGDSWPDSGSTGGSAGSGGALGSRGPDALPVLVEVTISSDAFGDVRKVFPLVSSVRISDRTQSQGNQGGQNNSDSSVDGTPDDIGLDDDDEADGE